MSGNGSRVRPHLLPCAHLFHSLLSSFIPVFVDQRVRLREQHTNKLKRQTDTKQEESEKLGELRGVWRLSSHSAAVTLICSAAPFLNYCQTRPHRAAFHGFTPGALWETKSVGLSRGRPRHQIRLKSNGDKMSFVFRSLSSRVSALRTLSLYPRA